MVQFMVYGKEENASSHLSERLQSTLWGTENSDNHLPRRAQEQMSVNKPEE